MDKQLMQDINQHLLLNLIREHTPVSRKRLKDLSGLSQGTIVGIVAALMERQLIVETSKVPSTGGRKAVLLELYADGWYTIGMNVYGDSITGVLLNFQAEVLSTYQWPISLHDCGEQGVEHIAACVEDLIKQCGVPREKILGVGCGLSGYVDTEQGVSIDNWMLNWHHIELRDPLAQKLGMPVWIDNAVNCLASYEKLFGQGQGIQDFLVVNLGRGLGLACVIRGDVYRGAHNGGAEFGHIPYEPQGRLCACGKQGCYEAYLGDQGVLRTYHESGGEVNPISSIAELFALAEQGNHVALKTVQRTGAILGQGLAVLTTLFNPKRIILYTEHVPLNDELFQTAIQTLHAKAFSQLAQEVHVVTEAPADYTNWARGAGCSILLQFFLDSTKKNPVNEQSASLAF
ncbi:ROK family transcriptional regulator [Dictyobacter arantiisoli]|nr:ROK family transcriptional regulator [Dictyobacter arantiisoli]